MSQCHKCRYYGKADDHCLSCKPAGDADFRYRTYLDNPELVA